MKDRYRRILNDHLQGFGTTVFAEMSALAARTGSINLGQGFPDEDGPREIRAIAARMLLEDGANQYAHPLGVPDLRTAIADHQRDWYGLILDPETDVLVTSGATEAIAAALLALVRPGDEVIVLEPSYDSYGAGIALAGGRRVTVPLRVHEGRYRLNRNELREAITARTRLLLLNTPHNPTGVVLSPEELGFLAQTALEHDLLVLSDEVYEHLVLDGQHVPVATFPGMRERTLTVGSAGKSLALTGWKVGWVSGDEELVRAVRVVKQFLTYCTPAPLQYAVAEGLRLPRSYFEQAAATLRAKRDLLADGLYAAGLEVYRPAGTYFVTGDVGPLGETDGYAFCRSLPERAGLVAIPASVFYDRSDLGSSHVRFAFCKKFDVLEEAVSRLGVMTRRARSR